MHSRPQGSAEVTSWESLHFPVFSEKRNRLCGIRYGYNVFMVHCLPGTGMGSKVGVDEKVVVTYPQVTWHSRALQGKQEL